MGNRVVVNTDMKETRVAIQGDWGLCEVYVERKGEKGIAGSIYKGRVVKVLPGMEAAFVDIGLGRAGFLYVTDVFEGFDDYRELLEHMEEEDLHIDHQGGRDRFIADILREGQEIMVQVAKEPLGTKGPRLTSHITLPGRYLVLMPTVNHIGISRRIAKKEERTRLKEIVERIKPPSMGLIVRTVSAEKDESDLIEDLDFLLRLWDGIRRKMDAVSAPSLLYKDLDLLLRSVRDFLSPQTTSMVIDDAKEHQRCLDFVQEMLPQLTYKIELYQGATPIFEHYGIEDEINKALGSKVWLKSGGYVVIEETEALTAIDVNTGRYVGGKNLEETIFNTNMEAAREVAHQVMLRNIGGIIIIDFIDMDEEEHKEQVLEMLRGSLKRDRYPSYVQGFSELGLVLMTRKRVKESLIKTLSQSCPYCSGRGYIKSPNTVCYEAFREVRKKAVARRPNTRVMIEVHPDVAKVMIEEEADSIDLLEALLKVKIIVKESPTLHRERFLVRCVN